jgi:hypothetical protein
LRAWFRDPGHAKNFFIAVDKIAPLRTISDQERSELGISESDLAEPGETTTSLGVDRSSAAAVADSEMSMAERDAAGGYGSGNREEDNTRRTQTTTPTNNQNNNNNTNNGTNNTSASSDQALGSGSPTDAYTRAIRDAQRERTGWLSMYRTYDRDLGNPFIFRPQLY